MIASIPFPTLERIPLGGDLAVSPHGIGIAVGFLLGAVLMLRRAEKRGLGHLFVEDVRDAVGELLGRAALGAIIGARLFFVLTHLDVYLDEPLRILAVWEGGLTFLGGLAGAIILALPLMIRRGYRPMMLLDSAAPGIALGLMIGRTGDLMIGDHIGAPAGGFALAWRCTGDYWVRATNSFGYQPPDAYPLGAPDPPTLGCFDVPVHQTALYDFGAAALVLATLLLLERRPRWDGFFVAAFVYAYGALRFLSDFARQDRTWIGLTGSQWAILAAMVAVAVLVWRRRPWEQRPWAWDLEFEHPWLAPSPTEGGTAQSAVQSGVARPDAADGGDEPAVGGPSDPGPARREDPGNGPNDPSPT